MTNKNSLQGLSLKIEPELGGVITARSRLIGWLDVTFSTSAQVSIGLMLGVFA